MFKVGDKIVCPMHGGAVVTRIYSQDFGESVKDYYALEIMCSDMVVNIPVDQAGQIGLREAMGMEVLEPLEKILQEIADTGAVKSISWNRRQQVYNDRLKTGDLLEVARVYKILWLLDRTKKISVGERRFFRTSKRILQSEIMLITGWDEGQTEEWLTDKTK